MYLLTQQNHKPNLPRLLLLIIIFFTILFGLIFLSGCISEKERAKICSSCPKHDSLVIKDTIVYKRYDTPFTLQVRQKCLQCKIHVIQISWESLILRKNKTEFQKKLNQMGKRGIAFVTILLVFS